MSANNTFKYEMDFYLYKPITSSYVTHEVDKNCEVYSNSHTERISKDDSEPRKFISSIEYELTSNENITVTLTADCKLTETQLEVLYDTMRDEMFSQLSADFDEKLEFNWIDYCDDKFTAISNLHTRVRHRDYV